MPDRYALLQQNLGRCLRLERKSQGISQAELAKRSGISVTYAGELERGEKMPSLDVIVRLAKALDITGAELLERGKF